MDQIFRQAFEKTAKVNLLNTIPKSTWSRGGGALRSGSGALATPAPSLAKPAKAAVQNRIMRPPSSGHADYLRSIGALGKVNPNEGRVLTYKPTGQPGKSTFESITEAPKTKIAPERGPLK